MGGLFWGVFVCFWADFSDFSDFYGVFDVSSGEYGPAAQSGYKNVVIRD
ncbi:hypothetical protein [Anaerobiospirillum sp. NML120449]|nr:hypothetical protein [Anaerobiospirillum sp. NML120449]MCK0527628.1 hypothetical protein [Anaerobiospirillum sp. NML120449]